MLDRVKELLVINWRSKQQARASIMLCIEDELDMLPDAYTKEIYQQKCSSIFQHVYQAFPQAPQRQWHPWAETIRRCSSKGSAWCRATRRVSWVAEMAL